MDEFCSASKRLGLSLMAPSGAEGGRFGRGTGFYAESGTHHSDIDEFFGKRRSSEGAGKLHGAWT